MSTDRSSVWTLAARYSGVSKTHNTTRPLSCRSVESGTYACWPACGTTDSWLSVQPARGSVPQISAKWASTDDVQRVAV